METLTAILQQFGKAGNVAALFASTLGLFVFIENMSSKQARADFTKLSQIDTDFAASVVRLPEDTRALFERVFGARHFSLRCLGAGLSSYYDRYVWRHTTEPLSVISALSPGARRLGRRAHPRRTLMRS
jgi:hypothetical protein